MNYFRSADCPFFERRPVDASGRCAGTGGHLEYAVLACWARGHGHLDPNATPTIRHLVPNQHAERYRGRRALRWLSASPPALDLFLLPYAKRDVGLATAIYFEYGVWGLNYGGAYPVVVRDAEFASKRFLFEGRNIFHATLTKQLLAAGERMWLRQHVFSFREELVQEFQEIFLLTCGSRCLHRSVSGRRSSILSPRCICACSLCFRLFYYEVFLLACPARDADEKHSL